MKAVLDKVFFEEIDSEELIQSKEKLHIILKKEKRSMMSFALLIIINILVIVFVTVQCANLFKEHSYVLMIINFIIVSYDVYLFNRLANNIKEIFSDMRETKTYIEFINEIIKDRRETNVND